MCGEKRVTGFREVEVAVGMGSGKSRTGGGRREAGLPEGHPAALMTAATPRQLEMVMA